MKGGDERLVVCANLLQSKALIKQALGPKILPNSQLYMSEIESSRDKSLCK